MLTIDLRRLRVSLTKNGYFKTVDLILCCPLNDLLKQTRGYYSGININRAQVANFLSAEDRTEKIPAIWMKAKETGRWAVESLFFIAVIFSHHELIRLFASNTALGGRGVLPRKELNEKAYTNLVYSMQSAGLCTLIKGAPATRYDLSSLTQERSLGPLAKALLIEKLKKAGWKTPHTTKEFYKLSYKYHFNSVLGLTNQQYLNWLEAEKFSSSMIKEQWTLREQDIDYIEAEPRKVSVRNAAINRRPDPVPRIKIDYAERDEKNRILGDLGEAVVVLKEQEKLKRIGFKTLANKVIQVPDANGYDIRSFDMDGNELYLEVKTTRSARENGFFVTRNELLSSKALRERYILIRIYALKIAKTGQLKSCCYYIRRGAIEENFAVLGERYLAIPK